MKILHTVEFYNPSVGGMQEVVRQISEKLILLGHSVTVATSYDENRKKNELNGVQIQSFRLKGNDVRGYQALEGEIRRYQDFIINSQFDVITIFAAQQWSADLILPLLKNIKSRKIFVPTGFSGLFNPKYRNYFENMKTYMKYFDMNVFLSDDYRDINFARENGIEKRTLIPNGAGEDEFLARQEINIRRNLGIREDCFLILHVGSHTGLKGHDEMFKIFQKAKINNSVLLIVGNYFKSETPLLKKIIKFLINLFIFHETGFNRCPESCRSAERKFNLKSVNKRAEKKIIIKELTRKETVAAYQSADLFLFPSNIECSPIVLFEAAASETPFLTSNAGNSEEIVSWLGGGILLPTVTDRLGYGRVRIEKSVKILEELFFNNELRNKLGTNGYKNWKNGFSWEIIAKKYEKLYQDLMKE